ncbi:MAG: hypothetical protein HY784_16050, partial [Chloroflexi bacterium]|nr:hypothetical protein [Chloroflexota bacterium]
YAARHCPRCARALAEAYDFCPGCGYDARRFRQCTHCRHEQFAPADLKPAHCIPCGQPLP